MHLLLAPRHWRGQKGAYDEYSEASKSRPLHFNASSVPDLNRPSLQLLQLANLTIRLHVRSTRVQQRLPESLQLSQLPWLTCSKLTHSLHSNTHLWGRTCQTFHCAGEQGRSIPVTDISTGSGRAVISRCVPWWLWRSSILLRPFDNLVSSALFRRYNHEI